MTTYSTDPALYIFTSLTAGSSHIVTATSRIETILRANRVPFKAVDVATDAKARMLWGRRAGKDAAGRPRKLPGLVQEAVILGDLVEIEDWNEYGELKQHVKIHYDEYTIPSIHDKPPEPPKPKKQPAAKVKPASKPPGPSSSSDPASAEPKPAGQDLKPDPSKPSVLLVRSVANEAAQKAKELRLRSLREKVHGKDAKAAASSSSSPATTAPPASGLQSPTSGAWRDLAPASAAAATAAAREPLQSLTSAQWRPRSADLTAPSSRAVEATAAEIQAVESELAIQEEPQREGKEQHGTRLAGELQRGGGKDEHNGGQKMDKRDELGDSDTKSPDDS